MNKLKLAVFAGAVVAVAVISIFAAHADATPLAVTCSGSVSSNQITWTASASGGNAPYAFVWSGDSSVAGSTSTSMIVTYGTNATYTADIQATDASSTVATSTCAATVTANPIVVATPTSTLPRVNQPSLSIGPNGAFTARGMTVTSIGSGSFQAQIWGITYTINWSGKLNVGNATSSPMTQLAVGDEVSVSGKVTASAPMTVNASVVRDFSITMPRLHPMPLPNGKSNGNGKGNGNNNGIGARLGDLMNWFKSHGGK